mmetsp:Transcript_48012/g.89899  ORF Transcript_48012/g.89899 Transcript_48012/m.89899 type:complete len:143 (-) Transcript_48012:77-505(-)
MMRRVICGSILAPHSRVALLRASPQASPILSRHFCLSTRAPIETRVIWAVQRFAKFRKEELLNERSVASKDSEPQHQLEKLSSEVTSATTWDSLGLDNVDRIEVLLEVEEEFGHTIPDEMADSIHSVSDAIQYLQDNVSTHI